MTHLHESFFLRKAHDTLYFLKLLYFLNEVGHFDNVCDLLSSEDVGVQLDVYFHELGIVEREVTLWVEVERIFAAFHLDRHSELAV